MAKLTRPGLGWLEPALEVLAGRYFGRGPPRADWTAELWMRAIGAALAERLGPALGEACAATGLDVPKPNWAVLAAARLENERRTEAQGLRLQELASVFQEAGIRPVLFKGLALARHYPARAAREVGDIDLLVAPDDLPGAEAALGAAGYEHWGGGGRLPVDYPLTYGRYSDRGEEDTVDLHPAWHEVTVSSGGREVVVGRRREPVATGDVHGSAWGLLPPAVEFYLTAAHAVLHSHRTLSVYLDMAVQLAAASAEVTASVRALARAQGRDRHLRHALSTAAELFDLEVDPPDVTVPRRVGVPLALRLGYTGASFRFLPSSLLMELALRRGLRRKLDFARWVLGHGGRATVGRDPGASKARVRRALRGLRWFKGTLLRYRIARSSPLRP